MSWGRGGWGAERRLGTHSPALSRGHPLEPRDVSLGPRLSPPWSPPSPLASHTWAREGVDQDAAAGGRVAVVGGADPSIGGDQHSGGSRVDSGSRGPDLAAASAPQQDRPAS